MHYFKNLFIVSSLENIINFRLPCLLECRFCGLATSFAKLISYWCVKVKFLIIKFFSEFQLEKTVGVFTGNQNVDLMD